MPPFAVRKISVDGVGQRDFDRRFKAIGPRGSTIGVERGSHGLHVPAIMLATANRDARIGDSMVPLESADVCGAIRQGTESNLVVSTVDTSGFVAARDRLAAVTGAITSLLRDACQSCDKVAVITFRGSSTELVLPSTKSIDTAVRRLADVCTGGRTPLTEGLLKAREVVAREAHRGPTRRAIMVLLFDGRAAGKNDLQQTRAVAAKIRRQALVATVVIDYEHSRVRLGLVQELSVELSANCINLSELNAEAVTGVVHAYHRDHDTRKA